MFHDFGEVATTSLGLSLLVWKWVEMHNSRFFPQLSRLQTEARALVPALQEAGVCNKL